MIDGRAATTVVEHPAADLLGLTAALVAVPSVHPTETVLADAVEARLAALGPLEVTRVANNVVARTARGAGRRVLLGGHLDTVPPAGNEVPRRTGDVLWGLGTADMKGSLAVLLALAEPVAAGGGDDDVTLLFYEGEEVAADRNGLRHLFASAPELVACDLAVLMEPTGGWIEAGCQGTLHLRATVRGRRAHTARPWMGRNAIHAAAPLLARIEARQPGVVEVEGLEFRESLQVVRVEGGVRNNVVPDVCAVTVNRRFAPARSTAEAIEETAALLVEADEVEVLDASPAAPPNLAHPLVAELVASLGLPVRPKLGWTDVARFAEHGIPAVNYGAGDPELAHTAEERVERADLERVRDGLGRVLGLPRSG